MDTNLKKVLQPYQYGFHKTKPLNQKNIGYTKYFKNKLSFFYTFIVVKFTAMYRYINISEFMCINIKLY